MNHNQFFSRFGMALVLAGLVLVLTVLTWRDQSPSPENGARSIVDQVLALTPGDPPPATVVILVRDHPDDRSLAAELAARLKDRSVDVVGTSTGDARSARGLLEDLTAQGIAIDIIAVTAESARWMLFDNLAAIFPQLSDTALIVPRLTSGSLFLSPANLRNVLSQISIVAIMAIGMTMVIISGGIDLSVGSLAALSAVLSCYLIDRFGGGMQAGPGSLVLFSLLSIIACGLIGVFNGFLITSSRIPPFIMTLAMMLIARGTASIISQGQTIEVSPDYNWLGIGATMGIPNSVILMTVLYALAYVLMNRMRFGRHLYAVGGNIEAAHLSGVPVDRILITAYTFCGLLAGLGGIILASQFNSGSHVYGIMYELKVIAAVVVGGTSLSGGQGHVIGTLIGALIIGVIGNGMNLLGLDAFLQEVVLGFVILGAVWIDNRRKHNPGR